MNYFRICLLRFYIQICRSNKFHNPIKKDQSEANSKPWFDNQIVSAIQRRDKLYKKFKHSGRLETDKDNFKDAKMYLQKMILKKNLNLKKN